MKRKLLFAAFILLAAAAVSAQNVTVDFKITGHEIDFMNLQKSVQNQVDDGYTPIGITDIENKLYILYLSDNVLQMKAWKVSRFLSLEQMDESIVEMISKGWMPAGFTSIGAEFYVLYLETDYKATYYKVRSTDIDDESLGDVFRPFLKTGTIPMGLDILGGEKQVYLSAQMANMPAADWKQEKFIFEDSKLNEKIAQAMAGRYLPWGLDITDGVLRINFVKFK